MGLIKDMRNRAYNTFNKAIVGSGSIVLDGTTKFSVNDNNELIENIYRTIANDFSLIKIGHIKYSVEDDGLVSTELSNSNLNLIFNYRTNKLQTPSDFYYTMGYNLAKYGNAIALPVYDADYTDNTVEIEGVTYEYKAPNGRTIKGLECVDVSSMSFGYGYSDDGDKYLLYRKMMRGKESKEVFAVRYDDIVHLRWRPNTVFDGDDGYSYNFNAINDILNTNLTNMLTQLSQSGGISGVLKLKGGLGGADNKENKAKAFINSWAGSGKNTIATLDVNEEFVKFDKTFNLISVDDIDNLKKLIYQAYGINENVVNGSYTDDEYNAYFNRTLEPVIRRFEQGLNYKLLSIKKYRNGERIKISKQLLIGAKLNDVTSFMDKSIFHGVATPNIIADMLGLPLNPNGNKYYTNTNAVELSDSTEGGDTNEQGDD